MYYTIEIGGTVTTGQATELDEILWGHDPNCYDATGWDALNGVDSGEPVLLSCDDGTLISLDRLATALVALPVVFKITTDPDDDCGGTIIARPDPASAEIIRGDYSNDEPQVGLGELKAAINAGPDAVTALVARLERFSFDMPPFIFDDPPGEEAAA